MKRIIHSYYKIGGVIMKVVIAYYSKHHRNTKKLVDAIKELGDIKLINVDKCKKADLSDYDVIDFASGIYYGKFSDAVIEFAKNNLPSKKRVFLINTYGWKRDYIKEMKQVIAEKSCQLLGIYGCRGFDTYGPFKLFGGVAKGHPNESDVKGAVEFVKRIIQN